MILSEVQKITPQIAEFYLKKNQKNRELSPIRAEKYAGAMRRGEWKLNGEPIIINGTGDLLDGQHRLEAVIRSGETVEMLVVSGIPSAYFNTIDQGAARSLADIMHIRGVENGQILAAALRLMATFEAGVPYSMGGSRTPSMEEMERLLVTNPGLHASAAFVAERSSRKGVVSPSTACLLHYYFAKLNVSDANVFWDHLLSGAGFQSGSHMHLLRDRITAKNTQLKRLSSKAVAALAIKTWNAIRTNKPSTGSYPTWRGGKRGEDFPVPV